MDQSAFTGREEELSQLNSLLKKKTASLVAVKGRRRVGKSRLIEQLSTGKKFYKFTGLAPIDGVTAQDQRNEFARKLHQQTGLPRITTDDWGDLLALLAREVKSSRVIILLDEISWMAMDDPTFLPKLKNAWDDDFKKNSKLILFLCSSVSIMIGYLVSKNISIIRVHNSIMTSVYSGHFSLKCSVQENAKPLD